MSQRKRRDYGKYRRPSAALEATLLLLVMLALAGMAYRSAGWAVWLIYPGLAIFGAFAILPSVRVDRSGIRIGRSLLPPVRIPWDQVEQACLPQAESGSGYPYLVTTDGRRVVLRPLKCRSRGWDLAYASQAVAKISALAVILRSELP